MILDTMTKAFAPILCFTCDEIWQAMPHRSQDDGRNVVLNQMNQPFAEYALSEQEMAEWQKMIDLRDDVNLALEAARAAKAIGKPLEAAVTLWCQDQGVYQDLAAKADLLRTLFIVSQVEVKQGQGGQPCRSEEHTSELQSPS